MWRIGALMTTCLPWLFGLPVLVIRIVEKLQETRHHCVRKILQNFEDFVFYVGTMSLPIFYIIFRLLLLVTDFS